MLLVNYEAMLGINGNNVTHWTFEEEESTRIHMVGGASVLVNMSFSDVSNIFIFTSGKDSASTSQEDDWES
jgi:hypothetical protein